MDPVHFALTVISIIAGMATTLFLALYFSRRLTPFDRMGRVLENVLGDDEAVAQMTASTNSLMQIGTAAESMNAILQDEELFDNLLQDIAKRAVKIAQMSMLGIKSGDSRRMAKAEGIVNEAMVKGLKKLHPLIDYGLRITELDKVIEEEPEMFQYIMAQLMDKGFLNMMNPESLALPKGTEKQSQFDFK